MKIRFIALAAAVAALLPVYALRIAVLNDIHVAAGAPNDKALREAIGEINASPFDMVVVNGDLATEGSDRELIYVKSLLDSIIHPLFIVPGNHESTWSQSAVKTFTDLWGADRFVTEKDSLVIVGMACGPYMKMGNGHIKREDLGWLDRTLAERVSSGKRVLSFNHYPLHLPDLDNVQDYIEILEKYPVIAHINGHYHKWGTYDMGGDGSGSDLPCVTTRALAGGKDDYGYTEVEVDNDWIHIYNKRIGYPREAQYAFAARAEHSKAVFPERPAIVAPDGFAVENIWTDSASVFTRLGFDADNVYFGNSVGNACAIDKKSGELRWVARTGASLYSRPVAMKGRVAVPAHDGIHFFDAATGKERYLAPSKDGPYVADGLLTPDGKGYIQGAFKRIERRRTSDGKLVWSYDSIFNYCQASPAIDGDDLLFGAWDTNLRMLDVRTGKLKWVWNNGRPHNMYGPGNVIPVITGERVYVVAPDRYLTAIDRSTGRALWRDNSHRYRESMGRSTDGSRVYAKTMDGELVAVDTTVPEFRELWTIDLGLGYEHAPCVIVEKDGYIYTGSLSGKVTITRACDHVQIASLPLGVSEVNGIDVDPYSGDIYVSLTEGKIFRISRK